ncbi:uncharacterized protein LOC120280896 [Dioscorea cayenensis subsp. rotundata]|uniref:Uncharacterized protein LOC120280896 n=1 Tax=Dioscorea cayennensis subsp. rotundata TaxID=55577 RepID=A0AB40D0L0_DIOCR|nr:uncharacterized protein LOC120280896 [Dioscorea cayenensis subsp. rotundata]
MRPICPRARWWGWYVTSFMSGNWLRPSVAGCFGLHDDSLFEAEAVALKSILQYLHQNNLKPRQMFITHEELARTIKHGVLLPCWRTTNLLVNIGAMMMILGDIQLHTIPKRWAKASSGLAVHGRNLHELTLFHQGCELPKWIMKVISGFGSSLLIVSSFLCLASFSFLSLYLLAFACLNPCS